MYDITLKSDFSPNMVGPLRIVIFFLRLSYNKLKNQSKLLHELMTAAAQLEDVLKKCW